MTFDNLTLIGVLFVLFYIVVLMMFSKTKSASKHRAITDQFINKAIQYRQRGTALVQPAPGPCRSCA